MSRLLDFATKYLNAGLAVIPLWPDRRKNPHLKEVLQYNKRLPTIAEWGTWARRWPDANIGLITGYWRNYVALDFDDQLTFDVWHNGAPGEIPNTWIVQTKRGYHVWFQVQDEPGPSRLYVKSDFEVLLRAKGGYCIVPPSVHWTGSPYKTICNSLPLIVPTIASMLPGWTEKQPATERSVYRDHISKKAAVRIEDFIKPIKEHPNSRGAFQAWCPFHDDQKPGGTPSAWINVKEQRFGCNKCWPGLWWDVVNVYAMLNNLTNGETYKKLRVRA